MVSKIDVGLRPYIDQNHISIQRNYGSNETFQKRYVFYKIVVYRLVVPICLVAMMYIVKNVWQYFENCWLCWNKGVTRVYHKQGVMRMNTILARYNKATIREMAVEDMVKASSI